MFKYILHYKSALTFLFLPLIISKIPMHNIFELQAMPSFIINCHRDYIIIGLFLVRKHINHLIIFIAKVCQSPLITSPPASEEKKKRKKKKNKSNYYCVTTVAAVAVVPVNLWLTSVSGFCVVK